MKRTFYPLLALIFVTLACSLATPAQNTAPAQTQPSTLTEPPPGAPATVTPSAPLSEHRCGDDVCDGPENAQICPEDCEPAQTNPPASGDETEGEYWVLNPTTGAQLYVHVTFPADDADSPSPALVLVPGGIGDGNGFRQPGAISDVLAAAGIVTVSFDPDGRGQSEGIEDYNGYAQQDGLAAVIEFAAALPQVDPARVGVASFSYGVTMASGALARHPDLPVLFLMDWEGPADRFDTTIDCSGPPRIDFAPCDDLDYWEQREALRFIASVQVPYQRLQSEKDHVQPDVEHAVNMIYAAVQGDPPWVRLNDLPPNQTCDPDSPLAMIPENESRSLDQLALQYALEMFSLHFIP